MASAAESSDEVSLARAWPRFWSRLLDIQLYSLPPAFLLAVAFPSIFSSDAFSGRSSDLLVGIIALPFAVILDAIILSFTGTSIGKSIAALSLVTEKGERVPISLSISRNFQVYVKGLILGIPLLVLIGYINGYSSIKENGVTDWDTETHTRVVSRDRHGYRTWLIGAIAIIVILAGNAMAQFANRTY